MRKVNWEVKSPNLQILNSFKAVKTKCIKIKSLWIICTSAELWFKKKKLGLTKDPIFTFRIKYAESKTEFANNSLNSPKIGKLNTVLTL